MYYTIDKKTESDSVLLTKLLQHYIRGSQLTHAGRVRDYQLTRSFFGLTLESADTLSNMKVLKGSQSNAVFEYRKCKNVKTNIYLFIPFYPFLQVVTLLQKFAGEKAQSRQHAPGNPFYKELLEVGEVAAATAKTRAKGVTGAKSSVSVKSFAQAGPYVNDLEFSFKSKLGQKSSRLVFQFIGEGSYCPLSGQLLNLVMTQKRQLERLGVHCIIERRRDFAKKYGDFNRKLEWMEQKIASFDF